MRVGASPGGLVAVDWAEPAAVVQRPSESGNSCPAEERDRARHWAELAASELSEYFEGRRYTFSVPVCLQGTPFQMAVWRALMDIPYGQTRSYKDVAVAVGRPRAVRAVGQANRANPLAIVVPCHRVVGASGQLVGYDGDRTDLKRALLNLEQGLGLLAGSELAPLAGTCRGRVSATDVRLIRRG